MKMLSWKSPYEGKVHMKCYIKGSLIMIIYKFLVAFVLVSILGQAKTDLLQEQLSLQFVGYSLNRKTYKLYDPHSHTIFVSRDVIFHKSIFLFQSMTTDCVQNVLPCSSEDFTEIIHSFMWSKRSYVTNRTRHPHFISSYSTIYKAQYHTNLAKWLFFSQPSIPI